MKTLGLIIGLALTGLITSAQDNTGATVKVTIANILSDHGTILASLHTADTFMKGQGISDDAISAKKGEVTLTFKNVKPGTYAIMVLHDENENERMDYEANGMPKERYATTGTVELYGPPTFEGSKFDLADKDLELRIRF